MPFARLASVRLFAAVTAGLVGAVVFPIAPVGARSSSAHRRAFAFSVPETLTGTVSGSCSGECEGSNDDVNESWSATVRASRIPGTNSYKFDKATFEYQYSDTGFAGCTTTANGQIALDASQLSGQVGIDREAKRYSASGRLKDVSVPSTVQCPDGSGGPHTLDLLRYTDWIATGPNKSYTSGSPLVLEGTFDLSVTGMTEHHEWYLSDGSPPPPLPTASLLFPTHAGASWEGTDRPLSPHKLEYGVSVAGIGAEAVRVDYEFVEGTPTPGVKVEQATCDIDYFPEGGCSGSLNFTSGGPRTRTVAVEIDADDVAEFDEIFGLEISVNPANATIAGPDFVRGLILDDDRQELQTTAVVTSANVWVNGEKADEYERVGPGDIIEVNVGPALLLFGDNQTTIVLDDGTKFTIQTPSRFKQILGSAWYKLLTGQNWKVTSRNAVTGVRGTTFTVETRTKSDRVRTYNGTVKVTGDKPGGVVLRKRFGTVCWRAKACTAPKKFAPPDSPFWKDLGAEGGGGTGPGQIGEIVFVSGRDGNFEIYAMNADRSAQENLTNNPANDSQPDWSADGTKIAFDSTRNGAEEIYTMNADGTGQARLTSNTAADVNPAWSPDGAKIAFTSYRDGNAEIYVMNGDGTGQTNVTNRASYEDQPAWSPDGTKIAFTSNRDGGYEVYVMNADGTAQTNLSNNAWNDSSPHWSPNGMMIAFQSDRGGNSDIYWMNADGTSQTRVTTDPSYDEEPCWSPDGARIAFDSHRHGDMGEIYVIDVDGMGETRLTENAARDFIPSWASP